MARADWRSASAYEDLRPLDAPAFAYEFLLRNPDFLSDHARLARSSRKRTLDRRSRRTRSPGAGGYDFERSLDPARHAALWTPQTPPERGDPDRNSRTTSPILDFGLDARSLQSILTVEDDDQVVDLRGAQLAASPRGQGRRRRRRPPAA